MAALMHAPTDYVEMHPNTQKELNFERVARADALELEELGIKCSSE